MLIYVPELVYWYTLTMFMKNIIIIKACLDDIINHYNNDPYTWRAYLLLILFI